MMQPGFVIAMTADIAIGGLDEPGRILSRSKEWLIVSRWGTGGEYLSISRTGVGVESHAAPIGLTPRSTIVGALHSQDWAGQQSDFLLLRWPPADRAVAGSFLPTDGYAHLTLRRGAFHLTAEGRSSQGWASGPQRNGPSMPEADKPLSLRIDAARHPWSGEFIENVPRPR